MGRLINTTAMTVDGVIDVSDWYVVQGQPRATARTKGPPSPCDFSRRSHSTRASRCCATSRSSRHKRVTSPMRLDCEDSP
jgi:hypothetical protein